MENNFKNLPQAESWAVMVEAAKSGLQEKGFHLRRMPGRGRFNVWETVRNGKSRKIAIRTTKDRWIAFVPKEGGTKWKTLDVVDGVMVAAVDRREHPKNIEVYLFDAKEVRARLEAAYAARTKAGLTVTDDFPMWIDLDRDDRNLPASVGSGLAEHDGPIAVYPIGEIAKRASSLGTEPDGDGEAAKFSEPSTIAEVMGWARHRIAAIAGVRPEAVKLDLKLEY